MKLWPVFAALVVTTGLVACIAPVSNPTSSPIPPTNTLSPSSTATEEPITSTPSPTVYPAFLDDFSGQFENGWEWIRESRFDWNLTEKTGFLSIHLGPNEGLENAENILLRGAPEDNFQITTRVLLNPYSNFQSAELIIYQNDNNAIFLRRAMCYLPTVPGRCVGNGVYFDLLSFDSSMHASGSSNYSARIENPGEVNLRLTRVESFYTAEYSEDGVEWILLGTHTSKLVPRKVGLIASNAITHEARADFDFFALDVLP